MCSCNNVVLICLYSILITDYPSLLDQVFWFEWLELSEEWTSFSELAQQCPDCLFFSSFHFPATLREYTIRHCIDLDITYKTCLILISDKPMYVTKVQTKDHRTDLTELKLVRTQYYSSCNRSMPISDVWSR